MSSIWIPQSSTHEIEEKNYLLRTFTLSSLKKAIDRAALLEEYTRGGITLGVLTLNVFFKKFPK